MNVVVLLDVVIDSDLGEVGRVGRAVLAACLLRGMSELDAAETELAVVEAVNNTIEHAYAMAPGFEVHVQLDQHGDSVVATITDRGRAIPEGRLAAVPDELPFDTEDVSALPEGGMGLFLIQQLMDEVHYQSNDRSNVMTLIRRRGVEKA